MSQMEEGEGTDGLMERVTRIIFTKAVWPPETGPLDQNSTAILWHIASRTSFAAMAAEMKTLNYVSSANYASKVLWPRLAELAVRQRIARERIAFVHSEDQS